MMHSSLPFDAKIIAIIGFAILYVPVTLMIIYSFNAGKLTSVWSGFSKNGTLRCPRTTNYYQPFFFQLLLQQAQQRSVLFLVR